MADRLPLEVLSQIFSYLTVSDRKDASQVCQQWYQASLDPVLLRDNIFHFCGRDLEQSQKCRFASHLILRLSGSIVSSDLTRTSFHDMCANLVSLSLQKAEITESSLIPILLHCSNLQILDLAGCNTLFMTSQIVDNEDTANKLQNTLRNLKTLDLSSIDYLSDRSFTRMMYIFPNLEKLSLKGNNILFHSGTAYCKNSSAVLTIQSIINYIKVQASKLKSLNFGATKLSNDALVTIAKIKDLKLEEMILESCKEFQDDAFGDFCVNQKELLSLNVSWCIELTDAAVRHITTNLHKLKSLSFGNIRLISNASAPWLSSLNHLEMLSIQAIYNYKSDGAISSLCNMKHLTSLDVSSCSGLDDQFFVALSKTATGLQHLNAGSCMKLSDISLHHISSKLHKLTFLRLMWCTLLTDYGLLGLFPPELLSQHIHEDGQCRCTRKHKGFGNTTPIRFPDQDMVKLTPEEIDLRYSEQEESWPVSLLTRLRSLNIAGCSKITNISLQRVIHFSDLQELNLNTVHALEDETLIVIVKSNRSLERLFVSKCRSLTDESIVTIARGLPRLTHLDISCNDLYTNRSMQAIATYSSRLQMLDVSMCSHITLDALELVEHQLKHLTSVRSRMTGMKRTGLNNSLLR